MTIIAVALHIAWLLTLGSNDQITENETAVNQKATMLTVKLTKGFTYQMIVDVTSEIEMITNKVDITESEMKEMANQKHYFKTKGSITYDYEVKDILPNGNYLIKSTIRKIKMSQSVAGITMEFDSETGLSTGMSQAMSDYFKKKIDGSSDTEIQKNGKIISTTSMDPNFKNPLEEFFPVFSDDKVKEGKSWNAEKHVDMKGMTGELKAGISIDFRILSLTEEAAELSFNGSYKVKEGITDKNISGSQTGTAKVDIATGMTKELNVEQTLDIKEINKNGVAIPTKMKNKIVIVIQ